MLFCKAFAVSETTVTDMAKVQKLSNAASFPRVLDMSVQAVTVLDASLHKESAVLLRAGASPGICQLEPHSAHCCQQAVPVAVASPPTLLVFGVIGCCFSRGTQADRRRIQM
jgi:hypothetical protein